MSKRYALIVGNTIYDDRALHALKAPQADVAALSDVLKDPSIGEFDVVSTLTDTAAFDIRIAIADLFADKSRDDLILLYFSGHGILGADGQLYLAVKNTRRDRLSATAIDAAFLKGEMDRSRSSRQVLILDCCNSGAFLPGTKDVVGRVALTDQTFQGRGRLVLTATDRTQSALEGDRVIDDLKESLFTHFLIEGLRSGMADLDGNGLITPEELYQYTANRVTQLTPEQSPRLIMFEEEGSWTIAKSPKGSVLTDEGMPPHIARLLADPVPEVREVGVHRLRGLLYSLHPTRSRVAVDALEQLQADDSRSVSTSATRALAEFRARSRAPMPREPLSGGYDAGEAAPSDVAESGPPPVAPMPGDVRTIGQVPGTAQPCGDDPRTTARFPAPTGVPSRPRRFEWVTALTRRLQDFSVAKPAVRVILAVVCVLTVCCWAMGVLAPRLLGSILEPPTPTVGAPATAMSQGETASAHLPPAATSTVIRTATTTRSATRTLTQRPPTSTRRPPTPTPSATSTRRPPPPTAVPTVIPTHTPTDTETVTPEAVAETVGLRITGSVQWAGVMLTGFRVALRANASYPAQGALLRETTTTADGSFKFLHPPVGEFWLTFGQSDTEYWARRVAVNEEEAVDLGTFQVYKALQLIEPETGSTVTSTTPQLCWVATPEAVRYFVAVYTRDLNPGTVVFQVDTTDTCVTIPNPLASQTRYYWEVIAYNSAATRIAYYSFWYFAVQ